MKTITEIHRQIGLLFATTSRATIRQDASASDGWLDLVLLPLPIYAYVQIAVMLSPNFLSMGAKFHGAKVLGLFASRQWMFQGTKVSFVDFSLPGTKVQRNEKSRYQWELPIVWNLNTRRRQDKPRTADGLMNIQEMCNITNIVSNHYVAKKHEVCLHSWIRTFLKLRTLGKYKANFAAYLLSDISESDSKFLIGRNRLTKILLLFY